jgi:galactose mutarotase-like enzyme
MSYRQVHVSGFPAIALRSEQMEVIVVPTLGAKLTNLRRLRGREWLWRNDQIALAPPVAGTSYVEEADSGGWDECFPTVGSCPLPGQSDIMLPDHGELWSLPWECRVYDFAGGTAFTGTAKGKVLPYDFHREVILERAAPVVRLHYRLRHLGETPFPWIWSAHPLFNVQPGTLLTLPSVRHARVDAAVGRNEKKGDTISWPPENNASFQFPDNQPWAMKLFADIGPSGRTILTDPRQGEQLELVVSPDAVPQIGMWINCGGWAPEGRQPYYNLGLEPCIGAPDRLDEAVASWKLAHTLHPGEVREWNLEIRLNEAPGQFP